MDKDFNKTFTQCPNCGSPDRFMESLGQELKDRKIANDKLQTFFSQVQGTLLDQRMTDRIPIGSSLPGFIVATDICTECGTIYAVKLIRTEGKFMGIQTPSGLKLN